MATGPIRPVQGTPAQRVHTHQVQGGTPVSPQRRQGTVNPPACDPMSPQDVVEIRGGQGAPGQGHPMDPRDVVEISGGPEAPGHSSGGRRSRPRRVQNRQHPGTTGKQTPGASNPHPNPVRAQSQVSGNHGQHAGGGRGPAPSQASGVSNSHSNPVREPSQVSENHGQHAGGGKGPTPPGPSGDDYPGPNVRTPGLNKWRVALALKRAAVGVAGVAQVGAGVHQWKRGQRVEGAVNVAGGAANVVAGAGQAASGAARNLGGIERALRVARGASAAAGVINVAGGTVGAYQAYQQGDMARVVDNSVNAVTGTLMCHPATAPGAAVFSTCYNTTRYLSEAWGLDEKLQEAFTASTRNQYDRQSARYYQAASQVYGRSEAELRQMGLGRQQISEAITGLLQVAAADPSRASEVEAEVRRLRTLAQRLP